MTAPMTRPTPAMPRALRGALVLEKGFQGEPWVYSPHWRVAPAIARRGWADEYRITPNGTPYYRISDAGRALIATP